MHECSAENGAREMEFDSFNDGDDDDFTSITWVKISKILVAQDDFSKERYCLIDRYCDERNDGIILSKSAI